MPSRQDVGWKPDAAGSRQAAYSDDAWIARSNRVELRFRFFLLGSVARRLVQTRCLHRRR